MRGSNYDDILLGSSGDDRIRGQGGNDYIDGGAGTGDRIEFGGSTYGIHVDLSQNMVFDDGHGAGTQDQVFNIERVNGSVQDDLIIGDDEDNWLSGNIGSDEIYGGDGHDTLLGGEGSWAADGADVGFTFDDKLYGEAGNDRLEGGLGNDALYGGEGEDVFVLSVDGISSDTIEDYVLGEDEIDLTGIFDLPDDFSPGTVDASDISDYVSYNSTTGELFVDDTGSGDPVSNGVKVATIDSDPTAGFSAPANISILVDDGVDTTSVVI